MNKEADTILGALTLREEPAAPAAAEAPAV